MMSAKRRDQKNDGGRGEHFAPMIRAMMESPAWRALPLAAQCLYPWLRLEWHGPKANNNGAIRLSVRQAAECLGVSRKVAAEAFHELQRKGFLVVTEHARLGLGGQAQGPAFEITTVALPHSDGRPRKLYEQWREGRDFPIQKAAVQNPRGLNGRPTGACVRTVK
jgi:hypothetical protein